MRVIGLDVGEKRIGVAKADANIRIATPVGFFNVDGTEWEMIDRIAKMNNTNFFVLGLPRSNEGNETKQSMYVRQFAKKLAEKIPNAKIRFQDESLTSVQAEERLKMRKKAYEKGDIDAEAATIILQDFVEHYKEEAPTPAPVVDSVPLIPGMKIAEKPKSPALAVAPVKAEKPVAKPVAKPAPKPVAPAKKDDVLDELAKELERPNEKKNVVAVAADKVKDSAEKIKDGAKELAVETKAVAKREGEKVALNAKKTEYHVKRFSKKFFIISPIVLVLIIVGIGGGLFIKKKLDDRAAYEAWKKEQEAKVAREFEFTIRPGENLFDIKKNFRTVKIVPREGEELTEENSTITFTDEEINEAFKYDYGKSFMPKGVSLEGFLMPETLRCAADEEKPIQACIERFLDEMAQYINEQDLETKYAAKGLSLYQGISLASVVQKEANSPDMPTVAQVFLTRLAYGIPLGSDVTVKYALDIEDPNRVAYRDNQAALQINSCYNTRKNAGLPCGPISMPSKAALDAVASPSDTSYLYFLTGDDGKMYYSYTEYEHNQNIYLHCQVLCNVSL